MRKSLKLIVYPSKNSPSLPIVRRRRPNAAPVMEYVYVVEDVDHVTASGQHLVFPNLKIMPDATIHRAMRGNLIQIGKPVVKAAAVQCVNMEGRIHEGIGSAGGYSDKLVVIQMNIMLGGIIQLILSKKKFA